MTQENLSYLLNQIAGNDCHKSFNNLYFRYYDKFFRIAYYYHQNEEDAKETTLITFEKLWENRVKLTSLKDFDNYTFIMIKNLAINSITSESSKINELHEDEHSLSPSPESELINEELFKIYTDCIDSMPDKMKEAYIKVKEENKSYKEAASDMNISEKTIDAHIQKAIQRLRKNISDYLK